MRKLLAILVIAVALFFAGGMAVHMLDSQPASAAITKTKNIKCNKACQGKNDFFFSYRDYDDYFVNDSDGHKDMVFSVYRGVPIFEGVKCTIVKNDSGGSYTIAGIICPAGVVVSPPPGPRGPEGE